MYENSEENIGWLRYLFDFIEKDFRTMDTLTDESYGDKLIEEFKQGNFNLPCIFLQTSPKEQKNQMFRFRYTSQSMFDHQPTNKQSSSEKPPINCSNEENSPMCEQIIKSEKMTTSKQGLQVLLIAPLLALAATQNKHIPLFLNNQEDKYTQDVGPQIIPDQESLDEENQVLTHIPWEYTQDLVQFLSLGSIDSEASSKKYSFNVYHQDLHQCDLVQREDEDNIIQHPSLNFGQLNDQKTEKQLSNKDEKFSHLVTQMAMGLLCKELNTSQEFDFCVADKQSSLVINLEVKAAGKDRKNIITEACDQLQKAEKNFNLLFLNNQEEYDMILGKQGSVDDHTNLQTDKETTNKMMFLKRGKKDPDEGIIKGSMSLKQQTKEPEEYSNHFKLWSMLPSDYTDNSDTVSSSNSLVDDHTNLQTDKETINEMMFFPDLDYLYEGTVPWEYTQASGPKIFPDLDSLDEETQVFTDVPWEYTQDLGPQIIPDQESLDEENQDFTHIPWEYTQDLVQFVSFGSIDSEASSKKYSFNVYPQDLHQSDLVQREDEDHIIQHPSLNFGQLNDLKTGKQLSNHDENFGKLYQKFSHLVTQMAMEDRKEVDFEMNYLSIDSNQVVFLL